MQTLLKLRELFRTDSQDSDLRSKDPNIFCITTHEDKYRLCARKGSFCFYKDKEESRSEHEDIESASIEGLFEKFFALLDTYHHCEIYIEEKNNMDERKYNFKIKKEGQKITRFRLGIEVSYSSGGRGNR